MEEKELKKKIMNAWVEKMVEEGTARMEDDGTVSFIAPVKQVNEEKQDGLIERT
jgi:hypothetical protein